MYDSPLSDSTLVVAYGNPLRGDDGVGWQAAILLAREALDYPVLESDAQLRAGLKPSVRRLKRADEDSARGLFGFRKV